MHKNHMGTWLGVLGVVLVLLFAWWLVATAPQIPVDTGIYSSTTTTASGTPTTAGQGAAHVAKSSVGVLTIADTLSSASVFDSWLSSTGVASQLTGNGPYTLFVPTNGAIGELPAGTFTGLGAAGQKRFVQYYVIVGKALDADALVAGQERALSGDMLNISFAPGNVPMINSSQIVATYQGRNGIVYLIHPALIPPVQTAL